MPFTFNCLFTGLCGFVFNKPLASSPDRARVLLAEGDVGAFREGLSAHRSMLLVPSKNLKKTNGFDPGLVVQLRGKDPISVYFLSGMEMSFNFHNQGTPQGLKVEAAPVADPEKPIGSERTSLLMVGRFEKGVPGAQKLASDTLTDPPSRKRVDSRVKIRGGRLFVRSLTQFTDPVSGILTDDIWDFKDAGGGGGTIFSQVLAEEVVLERQGVTSDVELVGTFLDAMATPAFKLEVGPVNAETSVEVTVLSAEVEGLIGLQSFRNNPDLATDIKLLYRLSTAWNGQTPTVGALPIPKRRFGGGGLPIHCPRGSFVSDPNA